MFVNYYRVLPMAFSNPLMEKNIIEIDVRVVKVVTFKVPKDLYEEVERAVMEHGFYNISEFIKRALDEYINYLENSNLTPKL